MGKAFIGSSYLGSPQPERLAEYANLARTAIEVNGGRFIVHGLPAQTHEDGLSERTIIIQFASVDRAMAAYESPAYQAARKFLGPVSRDVGIVEQADKPDISFDNNKMIDVRIKT